MSTIGSDVNFTPFKIRVLLIDDQIIIFEAIRRLLVEEKDIEFHVVSDAEVAVQSAVQIKPTVILQDLVMPGFDGFELVRQYRATPSIQDTPVIVLSSKEDSKSKAQGFHVGANDYLVKLPDRLELIARIRYHSAAYINKLQRDDAFRFLRESQQKLAESNLELQKLAALDGLTGVANRRRFAETLRSEWQRARRDRQTLSLIMCDIDRFQRYNDSNGHLAGDLCLKKVAAALTANLKRPADLTARYEGEEFVLLLPNTDAAGTHAVAERCRQHVEALAMEYDDAGVPCVVTISVGVASMMPTADASAEDLLDAADRAMLQAKKGGRNRVSALIDATTGNDA